jgi:hypothetical protein
VTAQIAGHVRIDGDFCPECSAKLDVLSFALSGKPLAPIVTSKTPRAGRKPAKPEPEEETLDLDDHSE